MNEDQLSNFNPLVLMRRAHEEDEATHLRTPLESTLASIRRFKPAAPVTGDEDPNGRNLAHRACLYFGASAAMRRKRRSHDAERIRRAREVLELLLDAALGGRGDQLAGSATAGDGTGAKRPAKSSLGDAYEVPAGGGRRRTRGRFGRTGRRRGDATGGAARARRRRGYPRRFKIRRQVGRGPRADSQRATPRRGAARERRARSPGAGCLPRGRDAARPRAAAAPAREAPSAARPRVREIGRGKRSAGERLRRGKAGHGSFGDARAGPDGPRGEGVHGRPRRRVRGGVDDRARLARRGEPFSG